MAEADRPVAIDVLLRMSLWICFPLNLGATYMLARPDAWLGRQLGLPAAVDPLYAALTAYWVGLFGCVYAWLALQPNPTQPLLTVAALGKLGLFFVILGLWLLAGASPRLVAAGALDLCFAVLWLWWLGTARQPPNGAGSASPQ